MRNIIILLFITCALYAQKKPKEKAPVLLAMIQYDNDAARIEEQEKDIIQNVLNKALTVVYDSLTMVSKIDSINTEEEYPKYSVKYQQTGGNDGGYALTYTKSTKDTIDDTFIIPYDKVAIKTISKDISKDLDYWFDVLDDNVDYITKCVDKKGYVETKYDFDGEIYDVDFTYDMNFKIYEIDIK